MHVVVSGNVCSGKSWLIRQLSACYGWQPVGGGGEVPYLRDYYGDMARWAFKLETSFMASRFEQALRAREMEGDTVRERSLWEGMGVFVENDMRMGNLTWHDYQTLSSLCKQMQRRLRLPDLTIYLRCDLPCLIDRIMRAESEMGLSVGIDYLQGLNSLYDRFMMETYPGRVLTIEASALEGLDEGEALGVVREKIDPLVGGLFPLSRG